MEVLTLIENDLPPGYRPPAEADSQACSSPLSGGADCRTGPLVLAEHGLSFLVAHRGRRVLFDTGKTGAFLDNAAVYGVRPEQVDALVLSHAHYDHSGGVRRLVDQAGYRGPVWVGPGFFAPKWAQDPGRLRYNGIDFDRAWLESRGCPVCQPEPAALWAGLADDALRPGEGGVGLRTEILPGIHLVGGFPRREASETDNPRFLKAPDWTRALPPDPALEPGAAPGDKPVQAGGQPVPSALQVDSFDEEVCLVLEGDASLVMLLGCAHPGLLNMARAVVQGFGKPLEAILGGSHLVEAGPERLAASLAWLQGAGLRLAALGHCTGPGATAVLARELPVWRPLHVGARFGW